MFELTSSQTSILISICGLLIIFSIIIPRFIKLKRVYWLSLKSILVAFFIMWIILFSDIKKDGYFFIGSFLGIAFLLKGLIMHNKLSIIYLSVSYTAFTFIFLSIGQTFIFIINICFAYIFLLGIIAYLLFQKEEKPSQVYTLKLSQKIISSGLVTIFVILFGFIIYYVSSEQIVIFEKGTVTGFFQNNTTLLFYLIFFLVAIVLIIVIISFDLLNHAKKEIEKSWYS